MAHVQNRSVPVARAAAGLPVNLRLILSFLFLAAAAAAMAGDTTDNADHAGIIAAWNEQSVERGRKLFTLACAPCHGADGIHTINPQSRPFAIEKFQNGSDPFSLFKTINHGFRNMPSQSWMTPEQCYDAIDYIREKFLKELNPSQYTRADRAYLDSLPKFDAALAAASALAPVERDFGPVLESQLGASFSDVLTFKLQNNVGLSYDAHRMRLAGAWQGGFLDLANTGHYLQRGESQPAPGGKLLPGLQHWRWAFAGQFDYPTNDLPPRGPLPEAWMKYHGHYVYGREAVLSFSIEGREILELPRAEQTNGLTIITHALRVGPGSALRLCVAQGDFPATGTEGVLGAGQTLPTQAAGSAGVNLIMTSLRGDSSESKPYNDFIASGVTGEVEDLSWQVDDKHRLVLNIPASRQSRVFEILCTAGKGEQDMRRFGAFMAGARAAQITDPQDMTKGAPRLWPAPIEVRGQLGGSTNAYVLDTIPVPFKNPYGAWLRTSALAFFPDGRAVVTTYGGDVWIVSGLDAGLEHVTWSRFASGLFEPFGAQVINGLVYVTCRNGIVRLHDFDGDGGADFYETFYADPDVSAFFHSFNFDLQVDAQGNLYYAKAGEYTDFKLPGAVVEVSPDGARGEFYCTGFRTPNGMGMLPDGRITVGDNQGNWMPASKISLVRRGGFYGYVQTLKSDNQWAPDGGRIDTKKVRAPATFDQPFIWMPQEFDNSSGGEVWAGDARFGPLSGRLLHTSFGKGWMYYIMLQEVGAVSQAAIVALPFQFEAGIMRARVNPSDGQVYATGMSGWQGPEGGKDGCLQRLRYTGRPLKLLDDCKVTADGLSLKFNFPLNAQAATNLDCCHIEQWNYRWAQAYGSEQWSVEHPGQKGHDRLEVSAARVSEDGRSVWLIIPGIRPANQVELKLNMPAADGSYFKELVYLTINAVPGR